MTTQVTMTQDQRTAANHAIDMYVLQNAKRFGGVKAHPVILLPRFEEDTEGEFVPIDSGGIRPTKKEGLSFIRFGMPIVTISNNGTPEVKVLKTNVFNDDVKLELLVEAHDLTIGSCFPDVVLVIEESLTPFSKNNPGRDVKYAGNGDTSLPCTFTGIHNGITYDNPAPIYRRVKLAPVGNGDTLITHTNALEISQFASQQWANINKPNTTSIKGAAPKRK